MGRLNERVAVAGRALATLDEILALGLDDAIHRDAAIQRFEYSFEAVMKALQAILEEHEGQRAVSPKAIARASFQIDLLSEEECAQAIAMVDDRNMTVHTYNESVSIALARKLDDHAVLLRTWLNRAAKKLES